MGQPQFLSVEQIQNHCLFFPEMLLARVSHRGSADKALLRSSCTPPRYPGLCDPVLSPKTRGFRLVKGASLSS
jgi:hypothetical protein